MKHRYLVLAMRNRRFDASLVDARVLAARDPLHVLCALTTAMHEWNAA